MVVPVNPQQDSGIDMAQATTAATYSSRNLPPASTTAGNIVLQPADSTNSPNNIPHVVETVEENERDGAQLLPGVGRGGSRFIRDPLGLPSSSARTSSQSPFRLRMPTISPAQLAFSALQYLPVPVLVLNNLKTVVLANAAMGRMLGITPEHDEENDPAAAIERLRGQTLSQVGIDMLQDGRPVWMSWQVFLDTLVQEMGVRAPLADPKSATDPAGDTTPTIGSLPPPNPREHSHSKKRTEDAAVDVVITRRDLQKAMLDGRYKSKDSEHQLFAKMIVTIWELEDRQIFFTLTFINSQSLPSTLAAPRKSVARSSVLEAAERRSIHTSNPVSAASSRESSSPSFYSPGIISLSSVPFPPLGPPTSANTPSSTPSLLQKSILMKDALLDNTEMPILAMWKDGSVITPNKAARNLTLKSADLDSPQNLDNLENWEMWTEDFSRKLTVEEFPISVLIRTETPFSGMRVGVYAPDGKKFVYDCLGEVIYDESSGEFLAGVITGRDVTEMTEEIVQIKQREEERFKLICDTMPQMVWTATPEGDHDFFNAGWYNYTGLTPEQSLGAGWQQSFHPDDIPEAIASWKHSMKTGEPYVVEYRCRRKDGEWRWFLGRALALKSKETGKVEKWFGTCTDMHEGIATKLSAKRTREQLFSVIAHSNVTIFTVDHHRRITMLEGALIWNKASEYVADRDRSKWFIGQDMYTVFNRLTDQLPTGERPRWLRPIEDVLDGRSSEDVQEHDLDDRWYRTRFLPMYSKSVGRQPAPEPKTIEGVIGVVMDVTELKHRAEALAEQSKEKRKAMAAEAAAKEANRLKSQFLANMSHEIRTPITGVLGMAELLEGMKLDDEQKEYVENIHSSATSLLTVINDILDFSKVESGRLDIEEVQFSLSLIVKEVVKMLQFAVERKDLAFQSDVGDEIENDRVVIGDPGRVRQIITNLLTNSIKFTNQGYVRFSARKEKETADSIEVKFVIEDTGIGIQDEVRKKLFQPFSQGDSSTARRFGGTGLGLTICKNLLDLMGGHIKLESVVGSGTTVTFWITFAKPQGPQASGLAYAGAIPDRLQSELSLSCNSSEYEHLTGVTAQGLTNSSSGSLGLPSSGGLGRQPSLKSPSGTEHDIPVAERANINVLVVEDNPVNQKIATKTISKLGFQVKATWNGKEALSYLMKSSEGYEPKPDIILMDVQMPVIDGYKCTHLLRYHAPYKAFAQNIPIVAMTASAIQGDREKCTKAGMDDYLAKPVTRTILEKMLLKWCTRKRKPATKEERIISDCSEQSEHCDNADIPSIGMEEETVTGKASSPQVDGDADRFHDRRDISNLGPTTPRPLIISRHTESSPFNSPLAPEFAPQVRQQEGEQDLSSMLQDNKLIDAAGGPPTPFRRNSYQGITTGEALTEANVNKLEDENQGPKR